MIMQKWEYKNVSKSSKGGDLVDVSGGVWMNELGVDGWELVAILLVPDLYSYIYTFKRPLTEYM